MIRLGAFRTIAAAVGALLFACSVAAAQSTTVLPPAQIEPGGHLHFRGTPNLFQCNVSISSCLLDPTTLNGVSASTMTDASGGGATGTQAIPLSQLRTVFDVRQAGAKLDGVTDDTAAFNAAQTILGSIGGGTLWIPKPMIVCGAVVQYSSILIAGPNEHAAYFQPASRSCPKWVALGDSTHNVTNVNISRVGWVQPQANTTGTSSSTVGQVAGTALSIDYCFMCGMDSFFARNPWDLVTANYPSGSLFLARGQIRTSVDNVFTINNVNDIYFDTIVADYDQQIGGASGNSASCFQINSSPGSIVISHGDFLHCGNGMSVTPKNGAGVEWLFVDNTAFDTCTSAGGGTAIFFNPTGSDANGNPSYIHGGKFSNDWGSGCAHGLVVGSDSVGFTEAMGFDLFSAQGNYQEGILIQGNAKALSFTNPQLFRNSASASGSYADFRLAGTGQVGNLSIVGGKVGDITDTAVNGVAHTFSRASYGIQADSGYGGTLIVDAVDLCNTALGGISYNGSLVVSGTDLPANIKVANSACSGDPGTSWTAFVPNIAFNGGSGTSVSNNNQSAYQRHGGKTVLLRVTFTVNYTTAPNSLTFSLPGGASYNIGAPLSGANSSAGFGLVVTPTGGNLFNVAKADGSSPVTASGQTITIGGTVNIQ